MIKRLLKNLNHKLEDLYYAKKSILLSTYQDTTFKIHPDKRGDLNFDDWHCGYSDCSDKIFPQYLDNYAYMNGFLNCLGMQYGYENIHPENFDIRHFFDGFQDAQYENYCHNPIKPNILEFDED